MFVTFAQQLKKSKWCKEFRPVCQGAARATRSKKMAQWPESNQCLPARKAIGTLAKFRLLPPTA